MKPQRGFALLQLGLVVAAIAAIGGIVYLVKDYLDDVDAKAYERGRQEVLAKTAMRDNEKLYAANLRARELQTEKDAVERKRATDMEQLDADYLKRIRHAQATHDRDNADLHDQLLVLRDPGRARAPAQCPGGGGGAAAPPLAGAGVGDGAGGGELSGEASQFLRGEALRADQVVIKLTACQAIVRADRATH